MHLAGWLSNNHFMTNPGDTIFALSSGPGRAAIAVIRVSGPVVTKLLGEMASDVPAPRQAALRRIQNPRTGEHLDDALVLRFAAPASATGEDLAEFHVHGGRAVVAAVLEAIESIPGCRPAEPGEFAHRAFINGKIDLTAAEGLADLIDAETDAQRRQAIRLADGQLAGLYDDWRQKLIECQALVEAAIDFSDESDVADDAVRAATDRVKALHEQIVSHLGNARRGEIIRTGFRVVIAGPPNAGKSTLLNALARRDAAIVSDEPGTTRDAIDVHMSLDGLPVRLTDTAGIRETTGKVESEGIRRAHENARQADMVIWLFDIRDPVEPQSEIAAQPIQVLRVANKSDEHLGRSEAASRDLMISAKTGQGVDQLIDLIVSKAHDCLGSEDDLVPVTARQTFHLGQAVEHLGGFLESPANDLELRAEDLRRAADCMGRLTGRIDVEDILDQIFSRFCIGK